MPYAAHQIMVDFAGPGQGRAPLTWGQREWWKAMLAEDYWWPLGGVVAVPVGRSLADLIEETQWRMCRYPALRTRIAFDDGGEPKQVVSAAGTLVMDVVEAAAEDPAAIAEELHTEYRLKALDYTNDWPMRIGIVCRAGQPTHLAVLICHLVIDAAGIGVLVAETESRPETPPRGQSPLEQAAWQDSKAGHRQNAAALRYWKETLDAVSPHQFRNPDGPCSPRYWHGQFDSYVLLPAVHAISERCGVDSSTVFLALFTVALHEVHGVNPAVVRPMVDNRFRPGLANSVCTTAQSGVCLIDAAAVPFDEVLQRASRTVLSAFKHAYADPWDVDALIDRVQAERETDLDTNCFLNNRLRTNAPPTLCEPAPASMFHWIRREDRSSLKRLIMQIDDIPEGVRLSLHIDTMTLSPAEAESLAGTMESVALSHADLELAYCRI